MDTVGGSGEKVSANVQNVETYVQAFREFANSAAGHNRPWLRKLREEAFALFCQTGFPTTHDEDWRFTNISAIARTQFSLAREAAPIAESELKAWTLDGAAARMVFVDGHFVRSLSSVSSLPPGLKVSSLKEEIARS